MSASEKIGQILRTPVGVLEKADQGLIAVSGKTDILERIVEEN